jgi:membrane fusion protein, multidrug efflux system
MEPEQPTNLESTSSDFGADRKALPAPEEHLLLAAPGQSGPGPKPKKRRIWLWLLLLCLLLGAAAYFIATRASKSAKPNGGKAKAGPPAIPVSVANVAKGNMGVFINAIGTVTPVYTVTVTSRVVGELEEVNYTEGQIVQKGDLLAVIDPRPYQAAYTQAQGQLARDEALLSNARIDLNRYKTAYEQHAVPEQTLATQQALVAQDEGIVKLDEGNLDSAKINLDYTKITSPITGRVGLRAVDPGNIVQANGTTGLLTIAQLEPITVIFSMAEDYISDVASELRAGHKLAVEALDRQDQHKLAQGTVLTIDNQVDTTTGTVRVRATYPNQDNKLFPSEFVNVRLLVKTLNGVNIIPTAAIQHNSEQAFVYVVNPANETVQSRNIQIATTDANSAAVTGVKPGEVLVTDGFDKLEDGTKVAIRKDNPSPKAPSNQASPQQKPAPNPPSKTSPQNPPPGGHK